MIVCIMAVLVMPFWKPAPFVRLLIPFITGIVTGYYLSIPLTVCMIAVSVMFIICVAWTVMPLRIRFVAPALQGVCLNTLVLGVGLLIVRGRDPTDRLALIDQVLLTGPEFLVRINEDPVEKKSTWKTEASVIRVRSETMVIEPRVRMLVYFRKPRDNATRADADDKRAGESAGRIPVQGEVISFRRKPEPIMNSPGTGSFDFKTWCALQNIHYQVFLKPGEFQLTGEKRSTALDCLLKRIRNFVIRVLRKYIPGSRESGMAEALLIGYKNDLDRSLVDSYAATGVVHVIAISGLHLGFIYLILKKCASIFGRRKASGWISAVFILSGLWLFSLLAGAAPSVLRSAVMFSSLTAGEIVNRRSGMMNGLAASAFILLCYDPYWFLDVGFQLSYTALAGIMLFAKPIHNAFTLKWKLADQIWKFNSVTLAAQVLTTPVSLYYFRQFPVLFLITNFIAVPLSSIVLAGELILCALSVVPVVAAVFGGWLTMMISLMNRLITFFGSLPFALIKDLKPGLSQVFICYGFIFFFASWLIQKDKRFLPPALILAIFFFVAGW